MTKGVRCLVALLGLGLMAAAPHKRPAAPLQLPHAGDDFPLPPIPPDEPPPFQAAPVPDNDLTAPSVAPTQGTRIAPEIFNKRAYNGGQGYLPGSTIEGQQEQRLNLIPGLGLKMPLQ